MSDGLMKLPKIREGLVTEEELSELKSWIRRFGPLVTLLMAINVILGSTSFITLILVSAAIPEVYSGFGAVEVMGVMVCYVALIYVLFSSLRNMRKTRKLKLLVLNKIMDAETPEDLEGIEKLMEEIS